VRRRAHEGLPSSGRHPRSADCLPLEIRLTDALKLTDLKRSEAPRSEISVLFWLLFLVAQDLGVLM
jgi:hypothetical protein